MKTTEMHLIINQKGRNIVPIYYYKSVLNLLKSGYSNFAAHRASIILK